LIFVLLGNQIVSRSYRKQVSDLLFGNPALDQWWTWQLLPVNRSWLRIKHVQLRHLGWIKNSMRF